MADKSLAAASARRMWALVGSSLTQLETFKSDSIQSKVESQMANVGWRHSLFAIEFKLRPTTNIFKLQQIYRVD